MAKAFRFDDEQPKKNSTIHAFKTLHDLKRFARMQGSKGSQKFWEIDGIIISDDGTVDGIQIRVLSVKEVF